MYTVETAIRIALLENTGLDEVAIKSVQAAVAALTAPISEEYMALTDAIAVVDSCMCETQVEIEDHLAWATVRSKIDMGGSDIVTIGALPCGPVVDWVIEKVGHPVSFTHYQTVADSQRSMGATVTEHRSRI